MRERKRKGYGNPFKPGFDFRSSFGQIAFIYICIQLLGSTKIYFKFTKMFIEELTVLKEIVCKKICKDFQDF